MPHAQVSVLDGALVVEFIDYHDPSVRYLGFTGGGDPNSVAIRLLHSLKGSSPVELRLVPEETVSRLDTSFEIVSDRDNFDYLYDPAEMVQLSGRPHRTARERRNRFLRHAAEAWRFEDASPSDSGWSEVISLVESWSRDRFGDSDSVDELKAVERCIAAIETGCGDVLTTRLFRDSELVAFDISELTGPGAAVWHFGHSRHDVVGAREHLRSRVGERLIGKSVQHYNGEQDLGVPGLRTRKLRDRPTSLLKKFVVRFGTTSQLS